MDKKISTENINNRIQEIEQAMLQADFWQDKNKAQSMLKEMQDLKDQLAGIGKYDRSNAIVTIFSGAGGDDAEDWTRMLYEMYLNFAKIKNFGLNILYENQNDHGGFRTITFEVIGKNAYGLLKNESGVHRLVRISPFNANDKRQTSFSKVEVLPELPDQNEFKVPDEDLEIDYTKSSGPGGQNVNKRETAVRIKHKQSGVTVFVSTERSQAQNKEKALNIIKAKLFALKEIEQKNQSDSFSSVKNTSAEWGNQIRSYVLHPYKMVKDHRTNVETSSVDEVLKGQIEDFLKS